MVYCRAARENTTMQDRWYGDNRDIVKWAVLLHLARTHHIECIVQVVFLQAGPDRRRFRLRSNLRALDIMPEVWEHFPREVTRIRDLAVRTGITIRVLNEPFKDAHRGEYVEHMIRHICDAGDEQKILFLDPDNGIAPRRANGRHVTAAEVAKFWDVLDPADWLVLYQHRQRHTRWLERTRAQFADACDRTAMAVQTFTCREIAHDVAFFALRKPRIRRPTKLAETA